MLQIKHHLQLDFPHVTFIPHHAMQLAPIEPDDDELLQELEQKQLEENINLDEADASSLEEFWSGVSDDLHKDPDWFDFAKD